MNVFIAIVGAATSMLFGMGVVFLRHWIQARRDLPNQRPSEVGIEATARIRRALHILTFGAGAGIHAGFGTEGLLVATLPLALLVGLAHHLLGRFDQARLRKDQAVRDEKAAHLPTTPGSPFFLYLRPFETTGRLPTHNPWSNPLDGAIGYGGNPVDLETALTAALSAPLVGLGHPGEQIGAGRIQTPDADWVRHFEDLAARASAILFIPGDSPGTCYELQHLESHQLFHRTIFLMPPERPGAPRLRDPIQAPRWEAAIDAARPLGLDLPPYDPAGAVFVLSEAGALRWTEPMALHHPVALVDQIERAIAIAQSPHSGFSMKSPGLAAEAPPPPRSLFLPLLGVLLGLFVMLLSGALSMSQFDKASGWGSVLPELGDEYRSRGYRFLAVAGGAFWFAWSCLKRMA